MENTNKKSVVCKVCGEKINKGEGVSLGKDHGFSHAKGMCISHEVEGNIEDLGEAILPEEKAFSDCLEKVFDGKESSIDNMSREEFSEYLDKQSKELDQIYEVRDSSAVAKNAKLQICVTITSKHGYEQAKDGSRKSAIVRFNEIIWGAQHVNMEEWTTAKLAYSKTCKDKENTWSFFWNVESRM